jgi:hypothetical protein
MVLPVNSSVQGEQKQQQRQRKMSVVAQLAKGGLAFLDSSRQLHGVASEQLCGSVGEVGAKHKVRS